MRKDRLYAIKLRKQGKSYNEINRILNVPKSTLSYWFKDLDLPEKLVERLYNRMRSAGTRALVARNKRQTIIAREKAEQIQSEAAEDVGKLSRRELFLVGAALYWAEGGRRKSGSGGRRVEFSNSDPAVITTMMRFFRVVCLVAEHKFRIHLTIHSNAEVQVRQARINDR